MSNPDPNLVPNAAIDIWSALISNTGFTTKKTNHIFKRTIYVTRNIYVTLIGPSGQIDRGLRKNFFQKLGVEFTQLSMFFIF